MQIFLFNNIEMVLLKIEFSDCELSNRPTLKILKILRMKKKTFNKRYYKLNKYP